MDESSAAAVPAVPPWAAEVLSEVYDPCCRDKGISVVAYGQFINDVIGFLIVSLVRVWQGKPHHIAPLDDATAWLNEKFKPMEQ